MTTAQICALLQESHRDFCKYIASLDEKKFLQRKQNKWSAGQQLEHIYRSVKPVRQAFQLPKFMLKMMFGTSNRAGRSYEELVAKYLLKLQQGGKASARFVPKEVEFSSSEKLRAAVTQEIKSLIKKVQTCSDADLDNLLLPHPLLGKLTLREMLYFTNYHVKHHRNMIENALA